MTPTWLAAVVALVAIAMTYFICVRPHLPGRRGSGAGSHSGNDALGRRLADLRNELRALQADHGFAGGSGCPVPIHHRWTRLTAPGSWAPSEIPRSGRFLLTAAGCPAGSALCGSPNAPVMCSTIYVHR